MNDTCNSCPIAKTAALLSDRWTMLILRDLLQGTRRFTELELSLEGISSRTLTAKLRCLESQGIIKKDENGAYSATDKGHALEPIERAMRIYGEKYLVH